MDESILRGPAGRIREWPIQRKLTLIIMATTSAALLLAGAAIVLLDAYFFYGYLQRDLSTSARIIADNSTAALAFDDPDAAGETLAALRARPHLVTACIYRTDETMLAQYVRSTSAPCPPLGINAGKEPSGHIRVVRPILLGERGLGTLVLLYDLDEIWDRTTLFGGTVIVVVLLCTAMASLLSARLRGVVATPISKLARVAMSVSHSKDYSLRAQLYSNDEIGILVTAFNEMLDGIQSRDSYLRKVLAEVQTANERLARSNEDLERFAYIASHDLQEPLRMITSYSQLLIRHYPAAPEDRAATFVEHIVSGTTRMRALLADLLTYAEIRGRTEKPMEPVDLNEVLEKVLLNLSVLIGDSNALITADRLPTLHAHEAHWLPVLQNLISNGIKYRSDAQPRIHLSVLQDKDHRRIAIADNGIGIDPRYHAQIFVAFKRLHGQAVPGTGIGLAICQRVVERYGGRIWVESAAGSGATFYFTVPSTMIIDQRAGG